MAPSAPAPPTTMVAPAETAATDIQSELEYLRQRNEELQLQLEKLTSQRDDSAAKSQQEDDKDGTTASLDSGLDLKEMNKITEPLEMVRSSSISLDGNLHSGLHQRRILSGKENTRNMDRQSSSLSSSPSRRHGCVKSKVSDVDLVHTTSENGYLNLATPASNSNRKSEPNETASSEEDGFDNKDNERKMKNSIGSKIKGTKKSSDGGGRYVKALSMDHGDEEECRFPDSNVQPSSDLDDEDEDENLVDDDSHNKHMSRNGLDSAQSSSISSSSTSLPSFKEQIKERAGWLIGLMFLQSCSSFIIQYNQSFLQNHMVIVQFLTMLVGAGGNAGNQASVRVIRSLALGTLNPRTTKNFLIQESKMALALSALIGLTGFIRAALFRTPPGETIAVTASVCMIVAISVAIGSTLPLGMKKVGIDPANSSTSIQVIMDILGVLITVCVSSFVLSFKMFQNDDTGGSDSVSG